MNHTAVPANGLRELAAFMSWVVTALAVGVMRLRLAYARRFSERWCTYCGSRHGHTISSGLLSIEHHLQNTSRLAIPFGLSVRWPGIAAAARLAVFVCTRVPAACTRERLDERMQCDRRIQCAGRMAFLLSSWRVRSSGYVGLP